MDLTYPNEAEEFRTEIRGWLEANLPDGWFDDDFEMSDEARKAFNAAWPEKLFEGGWICATWPEEYGGKGLTTMQGVALAEEFARAKAPMRGDFFGDTLVGPTILQWGTEEQKREFLPGILKGETRWCQGFSEPNSGSDLASLSTSAIRDGDDFVINGQKIWTSFGESADYCYLICRTDADGPPHRGISEVIVPMDTPGIEVRPITDMTTNRHFCEVWFTDVRVPIVNLVGVEGNAFKQTMVQLEHERGGIDRLVSNQALYELALERADRSDPRVRQEIAAIETGYRIGRILVTREVLRQAPTGFSAATKCFCTEHEVRVAEFVAETFGADAMLWDDVTHGLVYAPGYTQNYNPGCV